VTDLLRGLRRRGVKVSKEGQEENQPRSETIRKPLLPIPGGEKNGKGNTERTVPRARRRNPPTREQAEKPRFNRLPQGYLGRIKERRVKKSLSSSAFPPLHDDLKRSGKKPWRFRVM